MLRAEVARHPYPLLFATAGGAHLYGFPSPDSGYDLRGVHILPAREAAGLLPKQESVVISASHEDLEIDLVTQDVLKFFLTLLDRNGSVLEQLYSPLVLRATPEHGELKEIAAGCITRHHIHHYLDFSAAQWKQFQKENRPRVKPLLYVYRVLLTGIHLMRTGKVEAHLPALNEEARLPYIPELIGRAVGGSETGLLRPGEREFHQAEYARLLAALQSAGAKSHLPDEPGAREALNDLLLRVRFKPA